MTENPSAADWLAFALICGSALLAAVLEVFFLAEFYKGSVIIPVVIVGAIAQNVYLPKLGLETVRRTLGAVVPVAVWLVLVLVPVLYNRPEGDVFVLGEHGQQYAYYGLLFTGAVAGFATVVRATTPKR